MLLNEIFATITEGLYDRYIFKAIFSIGLPGSGKTTICRELTAGKGFKSINVDAFYEYLSNKKLSEGLEPETWEKSLILRRKQETLALFGRLPVHFDATGQNTEATIRTIKLLQSYGYDVAIMHIISSVTTAKARQELRPRKADPEYIEHVDLQLKKNISAYKNLVGENYVELNNDGHTPVSELLDDSKYFHMSGAKKITARRWFEHWLRYPVKNDTAEKWRRDQIAKRSMVAETNYKTTKYWKNYELAYPNAGYQTDPAALIQHGSNNPNKLPMYRHSLEHDDPKWAMLFRKRFNVAQRKFTANHPGYTIKRKPTLNLGGKAYWGGRVYYTGQPEPIGSFYFLVTPAKGFPKPIVNIQWLGLYSPSEKDERGNPVADWKGEQTKHRGIMTDIVRLFIEQVKDDISCVVLDDGSSGYWQHFFNKYYPNLTVLDTF